MEINSVKLVRVPVAEISTSRGDFRVDVYGTVLIHDEAKGWHPPYGFDYEDIHAIQIMGLDQLNGVH